MTRNLCRHTRCYHTLFPSKEIKQRIAFLVYERPRHSTLHHHSVVLLVFVFVFVFVVVVVVVVVVSRAASARPAPSPTFPVSTFPLSSPLGRLVSKMNIFSRGYFSISMIFSIARDTSKERVLDKC